VRGFFIRAPLNTEVPRGGTRAFYARKHTELFIHGFSDGVIFAKIIATRDALPPICYIKTYSPKNNGYLFVNAPLCGIKNITEYKEYIFSIFGYILDTFEDGALKGKR